MFLRKNPVSLVGNEKEQKNDHHLYIWRNINVCVVPRKLSLFIQSYVSERKRKKKKQTGKSSS
jgi:hypothetical protein